MSYVSYLEDIQKRWDSIFHELFAFEDAVESPAKSAIDLRMELGRLEDQFIAPLARLAEHFDALDVKELQRLSRGRSFVQDLRASLSATKLELAKSSVARMSEHADLGRRFAYLARSFAAMERFIERACVELGIDPSELSEFRTVLAQADEAVKKLHDELNASFGRFSLLERTIEQRGEEIAKLREDNERLRSALSSRRTGESVNEQTGSDVDALEKAMTLGMRSSKTRPHRR